MDASTLPKGQSRETTDGTENQPGVYVHKETGSKIITADGEAGVIQADALMSPVWHNQWERVGDVPTRQEVLDMQKTQAAKDAKVEGNTKIKADLEAFAAK